MKKLMIAVAAVAMAIGANAAAMSWKSGEITLADGSTKAGKGDVTAYLFAIDSTAYGNLAKNTTGAALSKAIWDAYGAEIADGYAAKATSVAKGSAANLSDPATYFTDGAPKSAYAAILYVDKTGDNYMGNIGTYTFESDSDWSITGFANIIGGGTSGTATAWQSVPEPTSGLLLLLGMAGLALRRRHA